MSLFRKTKNKNIAPTRNFTAGFTLIELLMCLVIIMIITFITRSSKTQFERSIFLSNQAYDIALAIREAQAYAINVRCSSSAGCTTASGFDVGYGVRFTTGTSFTLFADLDNDHFYDGVSERIRDYTIKSGNTISSICVVSTGSPGVCDLANPVVSMLDVTFRRPDSEACVNPGVSYCSVQPGTLFCNTANVTKKSTLDCVTASQKTEARLTLRATNGNTRVLYIYSSGLISIP